MNTRVSQSDKPGLLYLCHRIPYPPNKGDKIRSYHLLRYLCRHYRVYLGCFVDDPADEQYLPEVRALCEEVLALPLKPTLANIRSLTGLLSSQPLSVPFYRSATMQGWVNDVVASQSLQRCVVFSSVMAQFVMHYPPQTLRTLVDFVDVDSDKWRQYAHTRPWPLSSLLRREARQLLHFERQVAALAHRSFLVSRAEADLFRRLVPEQDARIDFFNNGVDTVYFDPAIVCDNPYPADEPVLVFTGAMDYWPNVDAVCWFVKEVFPALRQLQPNLHFYIVGRHPSRAVKQLARVPGVVVTGGVEDVRPYLKYALAAVAPMRIARGIQNKVLEAMAMAKVVLASSMGLEGIDAELGSEVLLTNEIRDYLEFLPDLVQQSSNSIGRQARERVMADFSWQNSLPKVGRFLEDRLTPELEHD